MRFVKWREPGWEECSFFHSTESFLLPGSSTTTTRCSARCVVFDIVPVVTGMVPIPTLVTGMSFSLDSFALCRRPMPCISYLKIGQFTSADHTLKGPSVYGYRCLTCPGYVQFTTTVLTLHSFLFYLFLYYLTKLTALWHLCVHFFPSRNHTDHT